MRRGNDHCVLSAGNRSAQAQGALFFRGDLAGALHRCVFRCRCTDLEYAKYFKAKNTERIDEVLDELQRTELPQDVTMSLGGMAEKDAEILPMVAAGLVASILIIFFILSFAGSSCSGLFI